MKKPMIALFSIAAFSLSTSAMAEHPGKAFHDSANCMKCHTDKPYSPQKTPTYEKLVKAVSFCNDNLNTGMFEDEVEQLADYLNQAYYKHPKP
ncbi:hypothetical protein THMIRHAS_12870 [Thiosulfatimonas sediminis]|uniref:Cytochrome c n=1 Tax=Thiosulfatimonas sediminis TaxID=2675054 RepID=A0A6F8PV78_9GAMM|nr:hypothetical protein [Thiosulfatimonas sediminis]BBP45914.1 hypothetical protein THMIRHAS_12870 [Thiosulfatimonas sediminis]